MAGAGVKDFERQEKRRQAGNVVGIIPETRNSITEQNANGDGDEEYR